MVDGVIQGWRYNFLIKYAGSVYQVPIVISDDCDESERDNTAILEFQHWVDALSQEASKL